MQQRYYDPIAGRFLSVDPVVADANSGAGFGLYTYVNNNPYGSIDPDGRLSNDDCRKMANCEVLVDSGGGSGSGGSKASSIALPAAGAGAGAGGAAAGSVAPWVLRLLGAAGLALTPSSLGDGTLTGYYQNTINSVGYREKALTAAGLDKLRAQGLDVHHIVQKGHGDAAVAVLNLAAVGIKISDLHNLVILPRADHYNVHTPQYRQAVNAATTAALPGGKGAMIATLDMIRTSLIIKGSYP